MGGEGGRMRQEDVSAMALRCLSAALGREIDESENLVRGMTPDWDSLKHVELMFVVEEETGEILTPDQLASITDRRSLEAALLSTMEAS